MRDELALFKRTIKMKSHHIALKLPPRSASDGPGGASYKRAMHDTEHLSRKTSQVHGSLLKEQLPMARMRADTLAPAPTPHSTPRALNSFSEGSTNGVIGPTSPAVSYIESAPAIQNIDHSIPAFSAVQFSSKRTGALVGNISRLQTRLDSVLLLHSLFSLLASLQF